MNRPLWEDGPAAFRPAVAALAQCERITAQAGGLVLRFGHLYGPGTGFAPDGMVAERVRAGKMPIVGDGSGRFSFTHTHDAATAIVAALDKPEAHRRAQRRRRRAAGDRRLAAPVRGRGGGSATQAGPGRLARMVAGGWGVAYMNRLAGASNHRARARLDWRPRFRRAPEGWEADFGAPARAPAGSR